MAVNQGKNLEKLITHMIKDAVENIGLKIISGGAIEKKDLPIKLAAIKRNLLIDYGKFGCHLPDVDIVIYQPDSLKVVAVLSSKVTLRERIAQSGYWKFKLASQKYTQHIKMYFVTPDEDNTFSHSKRARKPRAIAETDLDGSYILNDEFEESDKVKSFSCLIADLKKLV